MWTAAKSAYEPKVITAAVHKTQFDLNNIDLIIFVMAKLVDRQDKQQSSLPASGKSRQAHPHSRSIQTRQDSVAAAASHISQINAVNATASDLRPGVRVCTDAHSQACCTHSLRLFNQSSYVDCVPACLSWIHDIQLLCMPYSLVSCLTQTLCVHACMSTHHEA